jgi:threonine dehydratase
MTNPRLPTDGNAGAAWQLDVKRIAAARAAISPVFLDSPQYESASLNGVLGCRLLAKVETQNPISSFKARGAYFLVSQLTERPHLVCATAGNFGQGMAHAARAHGLPITIFTAARVNPVKLRRMQALGADVRANCLSMEEAHLSAEAFARSEGARLVEDGRDAAIAEGAGTIAMELLRDPEPLDHVLVPVGDGALLAGIACWIRAHAPDTKIFGVCAKGAPAMQRSFATRTVTAAQSNSTIADGLAISKPYAEAVTRLVALADDILLIDDNSLVAAMRLAHEHLGLVLEPSAAAGIAEIVANGNRWRNRRTATVLTGGNVSPEQLVRWLS